MCDEAQKNRRRNCKLRKVDHNGRNFVASTKPHPYDAWKAAAKKIGGANEGPEAITDPIPFEAASLTDEDLEIAEEACRGLAIRYRAERHDNPLMRECALENAERLEQLAERMKRARSVR